MVTIEESLYKYSAAETHQDGLSNCSLPHLGPFYANNSCDTIAIVYGVKQDCKRSFPWVKRKLIFVAWYIRGRFPLSAVATFKSTKPTAEWPQLLRNLSRRWKVCWDILSGISSVTRVFWSQHLRGELQKVTAGLLQGNERLLFAPCLLLFLDSVFPAIFH